MAIFGKGNSDLLRQTLAQLGRIGEDLAALKQQVADQQHAIDQTRREANAAIANGLTDNRAAISTGLTGARSVIREGLDEINGRFGDALTRIGSELGVIHDGINHLEGELEPPAPRQSAPMADGVAESAPEPQHEPAPDTVEAHEPAPAPEQVAPAPNPGILRAAAGIAHATLEAHRDTWAFLIQVAGNEQHFHIPGKVDAHKGFVNVRVSGPSLVAAITSLNQVTHTADSPVTQAIADHIHGKITQAVQAIIDNPRTNGDGTPVRIVIDDRAQADQGGDDQGGGQASRD
ncbi:hypothetical protein ABII15_32115 [Streptomyces sp. HUAS MG91]|uniref:Uncharacterized protein n=1 Tax=Streptomyces tabacisoli TaxID=3156398 RepID=A0AAU8J087_9ACTN